MIEIMKKLARMTKAFRKPKISTRNPVIAVNTFAPRPVAAVIRPVAIAVLFPEKFISIVRTDG